MSIETCISSVVIRIHRSCDAEEAIFKTFQWWQIGSGLKDWKGGVGRSKLALTRIVPFDD